MHWWLPTCLVLLFLFLVFIHTHHPILPSLDSDFGNVVWISTILTFIIHIMIGINKSPTGEWIWIRCDNGLLSLVEKMDSRHLCGLFTFRKTEHSIPLMVFWSVSTLLCNFLLCINIFLCCIYYFRQQLFSFIPSYSINYLHCAVTLSIVLVHKIYFSCVIALP